MGGGLFEGGEFLEVEGEFCHGVGYLDGGEGGGGAGGGAGEDLHGRVGLKGV